MPETKNVLELMTEMLQEQDNYENSFANNISNGSSQERQESLVNKEKNMLDIDQEIVVKENKVPSLKFHQQKGNSPNSRRTSNGNSSKYETSRNTDRTAVSDFL